MKNEVMTMTPDLPITARSCNYHNSQRFSVLHRVTIYAPYIVVATACALDVTKHSAERCEEGTVVSSTYRGLPLVREIEKRLCISIIHPSNIRLHCTIRTFQDAWYVLWQFQARFALSFVGHMWINCGNCGVRTP